MAPPLTAHFTLEEFACHDGTPVPRHAIADVRELCRQLLEPLRDEWGPVTIVSGYRTLTYNALVGGAPQSYHVYVLGRQGVAADIRCRRGTPKTWHHTLDRLGAGGLGLYPGHVHADTRRLRERWTGVES